MADKSEIFNQINQLEENLKGTLSQLSSIRQILEESLVEKANLRSENARLRERLVELDQKLEKKEKKNKHQEEVEELSKTNYRLLDIYNDGNHVCRDLFGKMREPGEECILCQSVIYR